MNYIVAFSKVPEPRIRQTIKDLNLQLVDFDKILNVGIVFSQNDIPAHPYILISTKTK